MKFHQLVAVVNGEPLASTEIIAKGVDVIKSLNAIAKMAFENPGEAMRQLESNEFHHEDFCWIRACINFEAARNLASSIKVEKDGFASEFDVHKAFWGNLGALIPGATRVHGIKTDGHNVPDGWIEIDGEVLPVEMKRDVFNGAARNQLMRYMKAYGARRGVAVCPTFRCETDPSIIRVVCQPSLLLN